MTRTTLRTVLAIGAVLGVSAVAEGQTEELSRTIPIGPGGRFVLSNISGDISVTGADADVLTLHAVKRVGDDVSAGRMDEALRGVDIEIRERGPRVTVETDYDNDRSGAGSVSVDFEVTVPRDTHVEIESVSGRVTMEGIDGETRVEVVSGAIRLASLSRLDEAETVSGDIDATDVAHRDDLSVTTVSGRIEVEGVSAPRVDLSSVSGSVTARGVESRAVDIEVVSGSVSFEGSLAEDGAYEFEAHSGNVRVAVPGGAGFELEAESFSGDLRSAVPLVVGRSAGAREVTGFEGNLRSLEGIAGAGGAHMEVSTFSGDIVIDVQ